MQKYLITKKTGKIRIRKEQKRIQFNVVINHQQIQYDKIV